MIPYGRHSIYQEDIDAVVEVLRSDFLTQGPMVPAFERAVATRVNSSHAIAVNSATSALHISCLALDLGPGDHLWTSPISFVASANCARYCRADVDFVDIDPRTYNLCPKALEQKLLAAKKAARLPKIVIPVHFSGQPCDMEAIHSLSIKYGFRIIEDASHAIGAQYKGEPVGSCRYSDITVFSFHPVKIVTTGEGGLALTNNDILAEKMHLLRSHGVTRNPAQMTSAPHGPWYYEQTMLGFNYRMNDMQAALGISQLNKLDTFIGQRRKIAERYDSLLSELPLVTPWQSSDSLSAWHLYVIQIASNKSHLQRKQVFAELHKRGIMANVHYIPIYKNPYYKNLYCKKYLTESEKYYNNTITLPIYPNMTKNQHDFIIGSLHDIFNINDMILFSTGNENE
jgi:UDP-4-amino-4,6-dideoxy-N-acetyl-beta-L-altrosamine transaminase